MFFQENKPENQAHASSLSEYAACLAELTEVVGECSEANWDGYKAVALDARAAIQAKRFIDSLPPNLSYPGVGAMPDGDICLDWDIGPRCSLTVVIEPQARLAYAMIDADEERSGVLSFRNEIPKPLLRVIEELHFFR